MDRKIPRRVEISEEALDRHNPDAAPALAPGATVEHHKQRFLNGSSSGKDVEPSPWVKAASTFSNRSYQVTRPYVARPESY